MTQTVKATADIFKALGDETRLKIVKLIAAAGNRLCVGFIAHKLGVSQPAVSQHLKTLKNAGLVMAERQGYHFHYRIVDDFMAPYGINTERFLQSFGTEFVLDVRCELFGKDEDCDSINK